MDIYNSMYEWVLWCIEANELWKRNVSPSTRTVVHPASATSLTEAQAMAEHVLSHQVTQALCISMSGGSLDKREIRIAEHDDDVVFVWEGVVA